MNEGLISTHVLQSLQGPPGWTAPAIPERAATEVQHTTASSCRVLDNETIFPVLKGEDFRLVFASSHQTAHIFSVHVGSVLHLLASKWPSSSAGNQTLAALADLEAEARGGHTASLQRIKTTIRDAITVAALWPRDLPSPDIDVDDEGVIALNAFRMDETIFLSLKVRERGKATYALLDGSRIVECGAVAITDRSRLMKLFDRARDLSDREQPGPT